MANILLVDDEVMLLELGRTLLEAMGHQVETYSSSNEAYAALKEGSRWDVYILDNSMPGLSGRELAIKLREMEKNSPVIIVSGYLEDELQEYIDENPDVFFLNKPFKRNDLRDLVNQALSL